MKERPRPTTLWRLLLIALLISTVALLTSTTKAQKPDVVTIYEATWIAHNHVARERGFIPEWIEATVDPPVIHYDLDGNVAAYVFSIIRDDEDVGYIVVSSQDLPNPVLEFSTAPARHKATQAAVRSAVERLGLAIDEQEPLYLGMFAYYYRIRGQERVQLIEMVSQRVIGLDASSSLPIEWQIGDPPISLDLPPMSSPIDPAPVRASEQSTVYKLLYGPQYPWYRGCVPTAVAEVMGYWADRGYPNLMYGGSNGDYQGTIDELANLMGTSPEGSTWHPIDDDIRSFAALRGYSFQSDEKYEPLYSTFVSEIDAHRPVVVSVWYPDPALNHAMAGFGYEYDPNDANYRYMILHIGDDELEEYLWLQYDGVGYSGVMFTTVIPPIVQIDDSPPTSAITPLPACQTSPTFDVSWSGSDNDGGWGIKWYDVQCKDGELDEWTDWLARTTVTKAEFTGALGHTYYFRCRAMDIDRNQEPYPPGDGDTHTSIAVYQISGQVINNRHEPVFNAAVTAQPTAQNIATTNATGDYVLCFAESGTYELTASHKGFSALPPRYGVTVNANLAGMDFVLSPEDEAVINGGWETGVLNNWHSGPGVTPTVEMTAAHTGRYGVRLDASGGTLDFWPYITQTVMIPVTWSQPALSIMHRVVQGTMDDTLLVDISDGDDLVTHGIPLTPGEWMHSWYDLSTFSGQTTTLRFGFQNQTGTQQIYLDEISLGETRPGVFPVYLPLVMCNT